MRTSTILATLFVIGCIVSLTAANSISVFSTFKVNTVSSPLKYKVWSLTIGSNCPVGYYYFSVPSQGTAAVKYTAGVFGKVQVDTATYSTATTVGASAASSAHIIFNIAVTPLTSCSINVGVGSNAGTVALDTLDDLFDDVKYLSIIGGSYLAATSAIKAGLVGGSYEVAGVAVDSTCPTGTYYPNATQGGSSVEYLQRGNSLSDVSYWWQTTIGADLDQAYNFWWQLKPLLNSPNMVCFVSVKVAKTGTGTMNLYDVQELFDGSNSLIIAN